MDLENMHKDELIDLIRQQQKQIEKEKKEKRMKYSLSGFNQQKLIEVKNNSKIKLNGQELHLLKKLIDLRGHSDIHKKIIEGKLYFWIKNEFLCEIFPYWYENIRTIRAVLDKLKKAGLINKALERQHKNMKGSFTFIRITKLADSLLNENYLKENIPSFSIKKLGNEDILKEEKNELQVPKASEKLGNEGTVKKVSNSNSNNISDKNMSVMGDKNMSVMGDKNMSHKDSYIDNTIINKKHTGTEEKTKNAKNQRIYEINKFAILHDMNVRQLLSNERLVDKLNTALSSKGYQKVAYIENKEVFL